MTFLTSAATNLAPMQRAPATRSDTRRPPSWPVRWAAFAIILYFMGVGNLLDFLAYGQATLDSGTGLSLLERASITGLGFALLILRYGRMRRAHTLSWGLLILVGYICLTTLWSADPGLTGKRSLLFASAIFLCSAIAERFDGEEVFALLARCALFAAVGSLLAIAVAPGLSHSSIGDIRGIFGHKNVLGHVMASGALIALRMLLAGRQRRRSWLLLALCVLLVGLSGSATALLVTVVYLAGAIGCWLYRKGSVGKLMFWFGGVVAGALLLIIMSNIDELFGLLGKDPSLTGRTEIWPQVIDAIAQRPLFGWGYQAFWQPQNWLFVKIVMSIGWTPPHAHNGVLELLLEFGFIGTALYLLIVLRRLALAVRIARRISLVDGWIYALTIIGIIITGATESVLLDAQQLSTIYLFLIGASLQRRAAAAGSARRLTRGALSPGYGRAQIAGEPAD